jgi:hypothetical protein
MIQAGVIPMTWVAVAAELQKDWRNPTGRVGKRALMIFDFIHDLSARLPTILFIPTHN